MPKFSCIYWRNFKSYELKFIPLRLIMFMELHRAPTQNLGQTWSEEIGDKIWQERRRILSKWPIYHYIKWKLKLSREDLNEIVK